MVLFDAPGGGLYQVLPSAAAALAIPGFDDSLGIGATDRIVVLLVDGLGSEPLAAALNDSAEEFPTLAAALVSGTTLSSPFPSTTPVGLASLGLGQTVGRHGFVGASFWLPESDELLWPLNWRSEPLPAAVQPEPTVFERVAAAGIAVASVSPRAFRESGLTRAVLRGGDYVGADTREERVAEVLRLVHASSRSLTYIYWGELDKVGHVYGVRSPQWCEALRQVESLVAGLVDALPVDARLLVTADHGMLDTAPADRIELDDVPDLTDGVIALGGEPRMRHVYCRADATADVADAWSQALAGRAEVMTRAAAIDGGWFPDMDPMLSDRVGDIIAVASGRTVLASQRVDSRASALIGQHGSTTEAEMAVPLLTWVGAGLLRV